LHATFFELFQHLGDARLLRDRHRIPLLRVGVDLVHGGEQLVDVACQRGEGLDVLTARDHHRAIAGADQLWNQLLRGQERAIAPLHRQKRLIEIEQKAGRRPWRGSRGDRDLLDRLDLRDARLDRFHHVGLATDAVDDQAAHVLAGHDEVEVLGAEILDGTLGSGHGDVDLGQPAPGPFLDAEILGFGGRGRRRVVGLARAEPAGQ